MVGRSQTTCSQPKNAAPHQRSMQQWTALQLRSATGANSSCRAGGESRPTLQMQMRLWPVVKRAPRMFQQQKTGWQLQRSLRKLRGEAEEAQPGCSPGRAAPAPSKTLWRCAFPASVMA